MPPRAPNFGGLWEAGVKSFKFYLKRTVGNLKMTLEEFLTIITQIEGILNSRPITPLSEDIDDLEVLTPGHFLIGRPITSISEPNLLDKTENTLSRGQKLTKIVQHIWTKWSRDYLNNLQQRNKWQFHKDNVKLNTMVLIKDDNLPVNKWSLGRITKLVPGTDGKVRVVEIKTNKGNVKRSIGKGNDAKRTNINVRHLLSLQHCPQIMKTLPQSLYLAQKNIFGKRRENDVTSPRLQSLSFNWLPHLDRRREIGEKG
ncbi:integrase catalytic domain-containing protein [Trichonephila clavipes]|nr:integrase catalytic domain-containing protein [Trichonephila clavipes]